MPSGTRVPKDKIEKAVNRYLQGEPASSLAREMNVSRPGFYAWINKFKEEQVEAAKRANMSAGSIDKSDKINLAIENQELKKQLMEVKQKLFEHLLASGKL